MARNLINKYVWIVDTIIRRKRITREALNTLWVKNPDISDGVPLPRRTFYSYCRAIEETFDITIACDTSTYEYYIEQNGEDSVALRDWLLDSVAISGTLKNSGVLSSKIMLENVPSARTWLPTVLECIKSSNRIQIEYKAFDRVLARNIKFDPYFVRIFRQRWYVIGFDHERNDIRTYALDRVRNLTVLPDTFTEPDFTAAEYFSHSFGIFQSRGNVELIKIKANAETARYISALPWHHTQSEELHDRYSIFSFRMYITPDLVQELLGMGANIEVMEPRSLRVRMQEELAKTLALYTTGK